jgi:hypothetical protein
VLLDLAPSHLHFARIAGDGAAVRERVLTEAEPVWALESARGASASASAGTTLFGYIALGILHITTGWDHLAFLLALLLLARRLREVAVLVTSFTAAHSVTLALAVLGLVRPNGAAIESLIGYSIALVAAENAWLLAGHGIAVPAAVALGTTLFAAVAASGTGAVGPLVLAGLAVFAACHFALLARVAHPARLRAAVAFVFGLVHGFGFAGVLAEMDLPTARLAPALFGFNVGVELGQLGAVALVWPALAYLAREPAPLCAACRGSRLRRGLWPRPVLVPHPRARVTADQAEGRNPPNQSAIARPISSGESSWRKWFPRTRISLWFGQLRQNSRCAPIRIAPGSASMNSFGTSLCASQSA